MNNEIDLWSLLKFYLKYWYIILLFAAVGFIAGLAYTRIVQVPLYQSDAKVTFINKNNASVRTMRDISNYADLVTSRSVLNKAIQSSGEDISFTALSTATTVTNDKNTDVLDISVTTPNPDRSRALASGITRAFVQEVANVYNIPTDEVRVIDTAQRSDTAVNVRESLQLMLATGAGTIIAFIILFFTFDYKNSQRNTPRKNTQKRKLVARRETEEEIDLPGYLLDDLKDDEPEPKKAAPARQIRKPGERYKGKLQ